MPLPPNRQFAALVLAGSRGQSDPVAAATGVPHKALAPVAGRPMLLHVLDALRAAESVGRIVLQTNGTAILEALPELAEAREAGSLTVLPTGASPAASVARALDELIGPYPLLVTTSDHPLLTPAMIDHFCVEALARRPPLDIAVGLAPASTVLARYPGAVRTFYRLGAERYSGCNLFALLAPQARQAIEYWQALERHRKKPWRLIAQIGLRPLALYLLNRLDVDGAMAELSRLLEVRGGAVVMPFAEAPIDVDKPEDLALVERILGGAKSG